MYEKYPLMLALLASLLSQRSTTLLSSLLEIFLKKKGRQKYMWGKVLWFGTGKVSCFSEEYLPLTGAAVGSPHIAFLAIFNDMSHFPRKHAWFETIKSKWNKQFCLSPFLPPSAVFDETSNFQGCRVLLVGAPNVRSVNLFDDEDLNTHFSWNKSLLTT